MSSMNSDDDADLFQDTCEHVDDGPIRPNRFRAVILEQTQSK